MDNRWTNGTPLLRYRRALSGVIAIGLALISSTAAMAFISAGKPTVTPAEQRYWPYGAIPLPACHSVDVTGFITGAFQSRETEYWNSALQIRGYDRVAERGLRPWGPNYIPRRFCTARAHMSDGRIRQVNYLVREAIGVFSNTWEVTWCVTGLDRHNTYAPHCKQAGPW